MWQELVREREHLIGGALIDNDGGGQLATRIVDVKFENGVFDVVGEHYTCSVNREFGHVVAMDGWFWVHFPYGGWRFRPRCESTDTLLAQAQAARQTTPA